MARDIEGAELLVKVLVVIGPALLALPSTNQ